MIGLGCKATESMQNSESVNHVALRKEFEQEDISRYSRQMILPEIGITGQVKLQKSKVIIVGAGGLGCPAIQYLASAGVGCIGIIDYDDVETSNLHRQILHSEHGAKHHTKKAVSAADAVHRLNSKIVVKTHCVKLDKNNAPGIIGGYDIVLDATDNVVTRYLLNDICVLLGKPLVSGSALRWEGQLTIYNYKSNNSKGPCYRCLYPNPPPPETVTNCSDGGVMGVIPGIIGCIQALEAIKIIVNIAPSYFQKLLIFDGLSCSFRSIKLRNQQLDCDVCGESPIISVNNLPDYELFCGATATDKCLQLKILPKDKRIDPIDYKEKYLNKPETHILVDVREPVELEICSLPNTLNISVKILEQCQTEMQDKKDVTYFGSKLSILNQAVCTVKRASNLKVVPVVVVCRLGNDSQKAVQFFDTFVQFDTAVHFCDMKGGLMNWAENVDKSFFKY